MEILNGKIEQRRTSKKRWNEVRIKDSKRKGHDFENRTRDQITDCIEAMAVWVLHNEFGFGQKRCLKFMKRFMDETECLVSEHISWKDIIDVLHTQIKTDIKIRLNEVGGVVTIEPDDIEL